MLNTNRPGGGARSADSSSAFFLGRQLAAVRLPPGPGCESDVVQQTKPQMQRPGHTGRKALAKKSAFFLGPLCTAVQSNCPGHMAAFRSPTGVAIRDDPRPTMLAHKTIMHCESILITQSGPNAITYRFPSEQQSVAPAQ